MQRRESKKVTYQSPSCTLRSFLRHLGFALRFRPLNSLLVLLADFSGLLVHAVCTP